MFNKLLNAYGALLIWDICICLHIVYDVLFLCNAEILDAYWIPSAIRLLKVFTSSLIIYVGMTKGFGPLLSSKIILFSLILEYLTSPWITRSILSNFNIVLSNQILYLIRLVAGVAFLLIQCIVFSRKKSIQR